MSELNSELIFVTNWTSRMFSKACQYGIKASVFIALQSLQGRRVRLKEIAEEVDSPVAFTAKILHQLAKNDILISNTGPSGGFEISNEKIASITLSDIVFSIDGNSIYRDCGLGFEKCNANKPCSLHHQFADIRNGLKCMLQKTSLLELAQELENGSTFLKR